MIKKLSKFPLIWLVPFVSLIVGSVAYSTDLATTTLFKILVGMTLLYLLIAILHHHKDKSLTIEIFMEYLLLAAFILLISQTFF